jgi:hypothetical protein
MKPGIDDIADGMTQNWPQACLKKAILSTSAPPTFPSAHAAEGKKTLPISRHNRLRQAK